VRLLRKAGEAYGLLGKSILILWLDAKSRIRKADLLFFSRNLYLRISGKSEGGAAGRPY